MAPLKLVLAALALAAASPAHADPITPWRPIIAEAAAQFGLPERWIVSVMHAESGGRTTVHGLPITSRKGAMGLMQLMPGTWADMRLELGLGTDPFDPRDNILAGTFYLRKTYDRFGYPGLFAAYHAGPERYVASLGGAPLPGETKAYLASVVGSRAAPATGLRIASPRAAVRGSAIFVELRTVRKSQAD